VTHAECRPATSPHEQATPDAVVLSHTRLTTAECRRLLGQLAVARRSRRAIRTGTRRSRPIRLLAGYVAGTGATTHRHGVPTTFDPAKPTSCCTTATDDSRLVGVAYEQHSVNRRALRRTGRRSAPSAWCPPIPPSTVPRVPATRLLRLQRGGAHDWIVHVWLVPGRPAPPACSAPKPEPHGPRLGSGAPALPHCQQLELTFRHSFSCVRTLTGAEAKRRARGAESGRFERPVPRITDADGRLGDDARVSIIASRRPHLARRRRSSSALIIATRASAATCGRCPGAAPSTPLARIRRASGRRAPR